MELIRALVSKKSPIECQKLAFRGSLSSYPWRQLLSQEFLRKPGKLMFGPETPGCGQLRMQYQVKLNVGPVGLPARQHPKHTAGHHPQLKVADMPMLDI